MNCTTELNIFTNDVINAMANNFNIGYAANVDESKDIKSISFTLPAFKMELNYVSSAMLLKYNKVRIVLNVNNNKLNPTFSKKFIKYVQYVARTVKCTFKRSAVSNVIELSPKHYSYKTFIKRFMDELSSLCQLYNRIIENEVHNKENQQKTAIAMDQAKTDMELDLLDLDLNGFTLNTTEATSLGYTITVNEHYSGITDCYLSKMSLNYGELYNEDSNNYYATFNLTDWGQDDLSRNKLFRIHKDFVKLVFNDICKKLFDINVNINRYMSISIPANSLQDACNKMRQAFDEYCERAKTIKNALCDMYGKVTETINGDMNPYATDIC